MKTALRTALAIAVAIPSIAPSQSSNAPATPSMMGQMMGGQGMMGQGMMGRGMMGSMVRHHQAMMYGIPEPYRSMRDPLPNNDATFHHGAEVYAQTCAACHGSSGYGDGPAGKSLNPPPANLTWLSHSHMMMGASDGYIYWAVAEGGQRFGTAMPAFKDAMSRKDIWSVVTYLRDGLGTNRRR